MKKIFKKSLACLIAVLMIVSSLPFATLTANAATTTSTATVSAYGIIKGSDQGRFTDPNLTICNDAQDGNFTIGFVNFDISNISCTDLDEVSASYNFTSAMATGCSENMGLSVWYPTANYTDFEQSTGEYKLSTINSDSSSAVFKGDNSGHIGNTTSYYSMKKLGDFTTDGSSHTVDIGNAIQFAKVNGRSVATICFMITSAGGKADESTSWTDTIVTVNKDNVNVEAKPEAVDFEKVKNKLNNFSYSGDNEWDYGSFKGDDTGDWATGTGYTYFMKNVLYGEKLTSYEVGNGSWVNNIQSWIKYPQLVFLYDGTTKLDAPILLQVASNKSSERKIQRANIETQGLTFTRSRWNGTDQRDNWVWLYSKNVQNDQNGTGTTSDQNSWISAWNYSSKYYRHANMLEFNGSFGTSEYVKSLKPVVKAYVDGSNVLTNSGTKSYYYINYRIILDKISQIKNTDIKEVEANKDYYTEASLDKYLTALNAMLSFSPRSLSFTGSNLENEVNTAGLKIKELVDNYNKSKNELTKKQYTLSFNKNDGSVITKTVTAGEQIGELPENTSPKHLVNTNTHNCYTWSVKSTDVPTGNATYTEQSHSENCTYEYIYKDKNVHTKRCTECGDSVDESHVISTDGNGTCTLCNQKILDLEAWNKAAQESGSILVSGASVYTPESFNEYNELYKSAVEVRQNATTQAEVDKAVAMLLSAQTVLRKKSVTVTLQKVGSNDNPTTIKTYENQAYGTALEIDLATEDSTIKGVEKWTISTDDGATTTKLSSTDTKLTLYVTKSATVTVYELDEPTDSETVKYSKVVFLGKNGVIVGIRYVAENTELETNTVTVPQIPFYDNGEWDTPTVTGTGNTIYVRAKYTASTKEEDMCNVHFGEWSRKYSYDSFVRPDGIDPSKQYALASDAEGNNILTYLEGVDFYAPKTSNIYVVEVSERVAKTGITGHFAGSDDTHRWATYNCKFYLPENCTAIEWGLEVKYGANTKIMKAESLSNGNEYTIIVRVKQGSTITNVSCRSYVTYKQGNETKTIYSDVAVDQAF
ncbi:hypothetical protein [uncultured Eubacterium sp.]|uniref:hypothetical protein n=1 Tax=uncultured Eubacterium sp. TaxID=165185 RepID=UPI0025E5FA18|nr:hypothetical protein [uncultured Eubacterium sp.]